MRVCFWLCELGPTRTSVWHKQKDKTPFCSQGPLGCDNNCRYSRPGFKAFWQRWQYSHGLQNKQRSRPWGCFLTLISMWGDWISENWDVLIEFTSNRPTEPRHRSRLYFTSNDTFPANSHNRIWITDKAYCLPKLCALSKRMEKACILQTKRPWVTADTGVRRNQILICTCKPGNYIHPLKILALSVGWVNIIVSSVNSWKRIQPIWEVQSPGFEDCMCSQGWAGCTGVGTHTHTWPSVELSWELLEIAAALEELKQKKRLAFPCRTVREKTQNQRLFGCLESWVAPSFNPVRTPGPQSQVTTPSFLSSIPWGSTIQ